ncbi:MAG: LPS export ABC transporter periplasmic protein LptC [Crocinitomicaceae bacterium]|nr:LPS export ABC transporter periplasmic protein LptC [Crocinitomicaceae bacterium]
MKSNSFIKIYRIPVVLFTAGILFSCVNDLDTIQKVTFDDKAPEEVMANAEVLISDSGLAQFRIHAVLAETYKMPERITKIKDGVTVDFFSPEGKIVSKLTAQYAEINHRTGLMFVRDSVVLRNINKNQFLETEELFFNQRDSSIYTDRNVIVKRNGKVGTGSGIRTTQSFSSYKVTDPVGEAAMSDSD